MTAAKRWADIRLAGEPVLLCGVKRSRSLDVRVVALDASVFPVLDLVAQQCLELLGRCEALPYALWGELEQGEQFFFLDADAVPGRTDSKDKAEQAALLSALEDPAGHPALKAEEFAALPRITFYAVCYGRDTERIAFVRKVDPRTTLRRKHFLRWRVGEALAVVEAPDIAIDTAVDVVVHNSDIAVLSASAFKSLFSDVRIAVRDVQTYAAKVASALEGTVPLTGESESALASIAGSRVSYAHRLEALSQRLTSVPIDPATVRRSLREHKVDPDLLMKGDEFAFGGGQVPLFLDVMEGRYFKDPLSEEERRADRFSPRNGSRRANG